MSNAISLKRLFLSFLFFAEVIEFSSQNKQVGIVLVKQTRYKYYEKQKQALLSSI